MYANLPEDRQIKGAARVSVISKQSLSSRTSVQAG